MTQRIDTASRLIHASPQEICQAFAQPGAMEVWLPPDGMKGQMLRFDFRSAGGYRMRLTYDDAKAGWGKTSENADEVEVRLVDIEPSRQIVQEVDFDSADPAYSGTMRMTWRFEPTDEGSLVTVSAENVPEGIKPEDHQAGLESSLAKLAHFTEPT